MSDTFDPYGEDEATAELIYQMLSGGYQPFQAQMNVPFQKEMTGSGTDPTRGWKSQDTILKSARSLMGFDPIEGFAGPEPQLWIPGTEQLAEEIAGDEIGQQLLERLEAGEGVVSLQRELAARTYDPETDGGPVEGRELDPGTADVYRDWLQRYSKARSEDYIKLGQPGAVTDPAELDPMADLPTEQAMDPNFENDIIQRLTEGGAFGAGRRQQSVQPRNRGGNNPVQRDFPSTMAPQGITERLLGMVRGVTQGSGQSERSGPRIGKTLQRVTDRGYGQLEQKYRGDVRQAQSTASRPSLAKERAFRAIVAYRLQHGMSPT